jgi:hypothetical protein
MIVYVTSRGRSERMKEEAGYTRGRRRIAVRARRGERATNLPGKPGGGEGISEEGRRLLPGAE